MRQQHEAGNTGRRLTLDERAIQDKVSTISRRMKLTAAFKGHCNLRNYSISEGLHRKISRDLLDLWKKNIKPLYDKEIAEVERVEKKTVKSVWYVQVCHNKNVTSIYEFLCLPYLITDLCLGQNLSWSRIHCWLCSSSHACHSCCHL